jgi:hypothetical protein
VYPTNLGAKQTHGVTIAVTSQWFVRAMSAGASGGGRPTRCSRMM